MADIRATIAKLLALSKGTPEEGEAKLALMKAWELMAKHKLSLNDIEQPKDQPVIKATIGVQSTKLSSPWAVSLAGTIRAHYSCRHYRTVYKGRKIVDIGFIGLEDDFKACKLAYCYAYDCIMARCKGIKEAHKKYDSAQRIRQMCHSYGWGFCSGLAAAFDAQKKEHQEWALVMSIPKAVEDVASAMVKTVYTKPSNEGWSKGYAAMGYKDGQEFNISRRLADTSKQGA